MWVAKCVWNSLKCMVPSLPGDRWDVWCPYAKWEAQHAAIKRALSVKYLHQPLYKPHGQRWEERPTQVLILFLATNSYWDVEAWASAATQPGFLPYQVVNPSTCFHTCFGESRLDWALEAMLIWAATPIPLASRIQACLHRTEQRLGALIYMDL